jgi:uncharacterized protein (DUF849 family)
VTRAPLDKVIIICAITGNLTLPGATPHLPISPAEIASSALGAADAGAAIVHIHVRDPRSGAPWMFPTVAQSYLAGGHVRVGLEDGVYLSRGRLAPSNAALVQKARRIVEDLGGTIATPAEARVIVGLPSRGVI